jgi:pimeloyl-ACP methyl ester carboxylesterase
VLLLHGFPEFWWSWRYQLPFLAHQGYRGIAPDLRGFNHSDKTPPFDPQTIADDLICLLDELGHEKAVVIGNDYGGFMAYVLALLHPERVAKLVVLNTLHPARWTNPRKSSPSEVATFTRLAELGHEVGGSLLNVVNQILGVGSVFPWLAYRREVFPLEVRRVYSRAYSRAVKTATAYAPAAAYWLRDCLPQELSISHETLVLWSRNDWTAPLRGTRGIMENVPKARLVLIDGAGHWVQQEQPQAVNNALKAFLEGS